MRLIITPILLSSILFSIEGIIVFNDQTIIEGDVKTIDNKSVTITPEGLTFPEEILIQSIDSVKINNGMIPVATGIIPLFIFTESILCINISSGKVNPSGVMVTDLLSIVLTSPSIIVWSLKTIIPSIENRILLSKMGVIINLILNQQYV